MKRIIILILVSLTSSTLAKETPIQKDAMKQKDASGETLELIEDIVDKSDIEKLTKDDIPLNWKTTTETSEDKSYHKKIITRGDHTTLSISTSKQADPILGDVCFINLAHKGIKILNVAKYKENVVITPGGQKEGYKVITQINKDSKIMLVILGPYDWTESVIYNEANSTLMDDLEYTKQMHHMKKVLKLFKNMTPIEDKKKKSE